MAKFVYFQATMFPFNILSHCKIDSSAERKKRLKDIWLYLFYGRNCNTVESRFCLFQCRNNSQNFLPFLLPKNWMVIITEISLIAPFSHTFCGWPKIWRNWEFTVLLMHFWWVFIFSFFFEMPIVACIPPWGRHFWEGDLFSFVITVACHEASEYAEVLKEVHTERRLRQRENLLFSFKNNNMRFNHSF